VYVIFVGRVNSRVARLILRHTNGEKPYMCHANKNGICRTSVCKLFSDSLLSDKEPG